MTLRKSRLPCFCRRQRYPYQMGDWIDQITETIFSGENICPAIHPLKGKTFRVFALGAC